MPQVCSRVRLFSLQGCCDGRRQKPLRCKRTARLSQTTNKPVFSYIGALVIDRTFYTKMTSLLFSSTSSWIKEQFSSSHIHCPRRSSAPSAHTECPKGGSDYAVLNNRMVHFNYSEFTRVQFVAEGAPVLRITIFERTLNVTVSLSTWQGVGVWPSRQAQRTEGKCVKLLLC